jgi:hypothetical protein
MGTPAQVNAFADFLDAIATSEGRRNFVRDPEGALGSLGALPDDVRELVTELSTTELRALSSLNEALRETGLSTDVGGRTLSYL